MKKLLLALFTAFFSSLPFYIFSASCTPSVANMCAAVDDVAQVWINSNYVGEFNYVNWDQTNVYPKCVTFNASWLDATGQNIIAIDVKNTECCEIWGSWTIEVTCAEGGHYCLSSDDAGMMLYNVPTPSETPPPPDGSGRPWYQKEYTGVATPTWVSATVDT
ncbi:MAG TPA: hypothetical protein P5511_06370, partial [Candidatus Goldiibacteriota bacterium]|nr:hypothetical protein [Candidatus Goldiibacteriota bacterium]